MIPFACLDLVSDDLVFGAIETIIIRRQKLLFLFHALSLDFFSASIAFVSFPATLEDFLGYCGL